MFSVPTLPTLLSRVLNTRQIALQCWLPVRQWNKEEDGCLFSITVGHALPEGRNGKQLIQHQPFNEKDASRLNSL